ncbi:uncharacterized protein [Pyxicephalus adspersus]|uniref:uncharacterized protein isoform X2 n=1 Tax=Pyxicephalus adspersus TaxID=30357 RepID=UPI003B5ACE7A
MVGPTPEEQTPSSGRMEKVQNHMTEKILNLTLEIIYLLTGEKYGPVKKSCKQAALHHNIQGCFKNTNHIDFPHPSLTPERDNDMKILNVTQKIIELLTKQVPIRCQDVTVYFTKEEKEYSDGHKDVTMDNNQTTTSLDGSRNTPERCPHPLYSQDSTQENQEIPQEDQTGELFDVKVKNSSEKHPNVIGDDEPCKEIPPEISTDGPNTRNTPERGPSPLYPQESMSKNRKIRHRCPREELVVIKVEDSDDEKEPYVRGEESRKEEEIPPEIGTDTQKDFKDEEKRLMKGKEVEFPQEISTGGRYIRNNSEKCPISYPDVEIEDDDITTDSAEENAIAQNFHPILNSADLSADPSTHSGCFPDFSRPGINPSASWGDVMAPCFDLNECFTQRVKLNARQKVQKGLESVSCSECGKSFAHKSNLITHERIHNSDRPYPCSICGKRFTQKSHLVTHKRIHTGEKPYSCSTCGKSFTDKSNLVAHQRTHTGLKPYSCPECGKSFGRRAYLLDHQRENKCERVWYFK